MGEKHALPTSEAPPPQLQAFRLATVCRSPQKFRRERRARSARFAQARTRNKQTHPQDTTAGCREGVRGNGVVTSRPEGVQARAEWSSAPAVSGSVYVLSGVEASGARQQHQPKRRRASTRRQPRGAPRSMASCQHRKKAGRGLLRNEMSGEMKAWKFSVVPVRQPRRGAITLAAVLYADMESSRQAGQPTPERPAYTTNNAAGRVRPTAPRVEVMFVPFQRAPAVFNAEVRCAARWKIGYGG